MQIAFSTQQLSFKHYFFTLTLKDEVFDLYKIQQPPKILMLSENFTSVEFKTFKENDKIQFLHPVMMNKVIK